MKKRRINVKHSQIFDYWKDKAITRDGKLFHTMICLSKRYQLYLIGESLDVGLAEEV